MNQKQYSDMTTIMQFCRIFSDQMYKCLKHTGLLEQGYRIQLDIGDNKVSDDCTFNCSAELSKSVTEYGLEEFNKTVMDQFRKNGEEWRVYADPLQEQGSIPAMVVEVGNKAKGTDMGRTAEAGTKPYPPDGLWISNRDFDCVVDGGM